MASARFGPEYVFFLSGVPVAPQRLEPGEVIRIHGMEGEYKVISRLVEKGRTSIEAEFIPDEFFKVAYKGQTFGVEAICRQHNTHGTEYYVHDTRMFFDRKSGEFRSRTIGKWIPAVDSVRV